MQMHESPTAATHSSAFRLETSVEIGIHAEPTRIWQLLTSADDFPRWNSTVSSIEGRIAAGEKLKLRVPISDRTFTPKVTALEPEQRMIWSDGAAPFFKGVRTFELEASSGQTVFRMREVMTGIFLPMIKGSFPDFAPVFAQYAADLKREAESAG